MIDRLGELREQALGELESIDNLSDLEAWRVRHLGRKSALTQVLRGLAGLSLEEKRASGAAANELRSLFEAQLALKLLEHG